MRARRLQLLRQALGETPFILCIDETGDRKKGHTTDYVAHQYIGNVHTLANGIVSVNAYGVLNGVTFPLVFSLYKPKSRLKPDDVYHSKPQLAVELVQQLAALGFHFSVVLADSMYGESYDFTSAISRLGVPYVVAIRSNHGVWTAKGERQRQTRWRAFDRTFSDGATERRYLQELIFGRRMRVRFFCVTTDPVHLPPETTWLLMTTLPERAEQTVGDLFGSRTWIEYGFKQVKDELGWADYRVTDAAEHRALVGSGHERLPARESAEPGLCGARDHADSVTCLAPRGPSCLERRDRLEASAQQPPPPAPTPRLRRASSCPGCSSYRCHTCALVSTTCAPS